MFGKQEAVSASVSDCLSSYVWRNNHQKGVAEFTRISDGFVLKTKPLPGEKSMPRKIEIIGMKFGSLTVKRETEKRDTANNSLYECECDCGVTIECASYPLRKGLKVKCSSKCQGAPVAIARIETPEIAPAPVIEIKTPVAAADLKTTADTVEAIITLCEQVPVDSAEALVAEIERLMSVQSPLFRQTGNLASFHRTAQAFLDFRRELQG